MKIPTVSIIVLSFNTHLLLKNCLKSISDSSSRLSYEVIVVDNHSQDGSVGMVRSRFPAVELIVNRKNLGFSHGNNQGIKKARGQFILLLNSDTIVHKDAISRMADFLTKHKRVGAIGCRLVNIDGSNQASAGSFPNLWISAIMLFKEHFLSSNNVRGSFDEIRKVDWVMGAAIMIKRKVFEKVGLMDENIFMYMEEVELCYRIKKAGYEVIYYPDTKITHLGQGSSQTGRKEPILNIYKGLLYFYKKHYSRVEVEILRLMLKTKALSALLLSFFTQDRYLRETYGQAFKIS